MVAPCDPRRWTTDHDVPDDRPCASRRFSRVLDLHAPDGFLSVGVALAMWVVTVAVLAISVSRVSRTLDERAIPLMGVTAAFIFAAQMFNFPVAGGTSGHLLGAVLAAVLLGPWAATLVMATVIGVQALVFQDGGLVVLGREHPQHGDHRHAGRLCHLPGHLPRPRRGGPRPARRRRRRGMVSVILGALAMTVELAVSGTSPLAVALPAMLGVHAIIGIGEALITVGALALISAVRPDLLKLRDASMPTPSPQAA